ncbi:spore germination protein [Paenibacillus piri]|uniref:Spore germination protein n=1 Tax=Paenibacillus piri TaxID=2547395 RepID=A0A4R5KGG3_9BACL|nr:spore germination protein [Paenibacillus piri]TDF94112.1 spore germination protein [Paenibacillus piri]
MFRFLLSRLAPQPKQRIRYAQSNEGSAALSASLETNLGYIRTALATPNDLLIRIIALGAEKQACATVCLDGLVNKELINTNVLKPLQAFNWDTSNYLQQAEQGAGLLNQMAEVLPLNGISRSDRMEACLLAVLSGETVLLVDGAAEALIIGSQGWDGRAVEEPQTEALIRGPREGFTENLRTNMSLVRRRMKDPKLRFFDMRIGRRSQTQIVIAYTEGIANPELVREVQRRISTIDVDDVIGSGYIEQWISDSFMSPFPQILATERPDKVAAAVVQGKVAILVDTTPFALILPVTIGAIIQSPEDYYSHWLIATLMRILRLIAAFIATFLPAFYIALVEYHQGMIPSLLAFSIAGSREGVPFPAVIETLLMEGTLEILREAGVRLPKPIGQTIGIVGGLVIGEAAVAAGIVSPIMVIVVAITAISSFTLPSYPFAITLRIIRFAIMIAAALFGLYGIVLSYIIINIHIVNLKSFGIPYSAPFAPFFKKDWKDLVLRAPTTMLDTRPDMMQTEDRTRMNRDLR